MLYKNILLTLQHYCASTAFPLLSYLKLSRRFHLDGSLGGTRLGSHTLDGLDYVHSFHNLAKDNVLSVQPCRLGSAEEELRAVCVGSFYCNDVMCESTMSAYPFIVQKIQRLYKDVPALAMERIPGPVCFN